MSYFRSCRAVRYVPALDESVDGDTRGHVGLTREQSDIFPSAAIPFCDFRPLDEHWRHGMVVRSKVTSRRSLFLCGQPQPYVAGCGLSALWYNS
jgi:hypothetical protein